MPARRPVLFYGEQGAANAAKSSQQRPVYANASISGYIKDAANGEGLIGVSVYVKETGTGAVTNSYGFYALTLPVGNYTLVISYVGYARQSKSIDLTGEMCALTWN